MFRNLKPTLQFRHLFLRANYSTECRLWLCGCVLMITLSRQAPHVFNICRGPGSYPISFPHRCHMTTEVGYTQFYPFPRLRNINCQLKFDRKEFNFGVRAQRRLRYITQCQPFLRRVYKVCGWLFCYAQKWGCWAFFCFKRKYLWFNMYFIVNLRVHPPRGFVLSRATPWQSPWKLSVVPLQPGGIEAAGSNRGKRQTCDSMGICMP